MEPALEDDKPYPQNKGDFMHLALAFFFTLLLVSSCAAPKTEAQGPKVSPLPERTYPTGACDFAPANDSPLTIITGAKLFPISAPPIESGYIVLENGKITAIGDGEAPQRDNAIVIDATGSFITPGVIDTHSHMGVYSNPSVRAHSDGNEMVGPVTGDIWAEHGFWPQDPSIRRALSGGVTTIQVLQAPPI